MKKDNIYLINNYSSAIYNSIEDKTLLEENLEFIQELVETIEKKFSIDIFFNQECKQVFIESLESITHNQLILNFLKIIIKSNHIHLFQKILKEVKKKIQDQKNIFIATIVSAKEITLKEEELKKYLSNYFNKDIKVHNEIDESILGGFKIFFQDLLLDNSVLDKLNKIRNYI